VKKILLIDDDLGVLFWLGETLVKAGLCALPATSCRHAEELLGRYGLSMDLVLVNPQLPGAAGLVFSLRRTTPQPKVIALIEDYDEVPMIPHADGFYRRPRPDELEEGAEQLRALLGVLRDPIH